ncbi:hypothetical protein KA057_02870 [Candidatus Gracilibacteria bacterium]|nr:hypothetical protein [Candidatus Gracilibacteria bacterium]
MAKTKETSPELQLLKDIEAANQIKESKVNQMESLIHNFDVQKIITLNERLQKYYKAIGDERTLDLLDRMTLAMNELSEIIEQVQTKRISLEQGQKEIQEKLVEINEVLQMMNDWETTGL